MKTTFILLIICFFGLLMVSCSDSSTGSGGSMGGDGGDGGDGGGGAPVEPTFTNVEKIFNGNCAVSGCHDSSTKQNGVDLSSYSSAINSEGDQYGKKVIQPNDAAGSPLVDKISSDNPDHGVRMPKGRSPLSDDQIDLIKKWINDGAKNN